VDPARRELRANAVAVPLGTRAFDIVEVLVQSAGELVTKDEIMRRVWSGAIVEESTLQVHISAIRKALGPDRGLLKTVFGRGYRLLGHWPLTQRAVPPDPVVLQIVPASVASSSNLPLPTSELIGRETAAQHLLALLSAYRVVTLTGPGGIGKSVLALDVARQFLAREAGDGWLVELAPLSDPRLVPSTVAGVLGLKLGEDAISDEAVARAIGTKQLLLVLDNCEHVVDAAATFAETVMRLCPRTTVLATSREVFRIGGEHVYRVPPLEVPPEDPEDPSDILRHSAVALFIARTRALDSDFSTNGDDLSAIAAICRHLDGIPLAIEFAAARSAVLGARQTASRLDNRFALLTSGRRNALSRHRTLRAALDWSYEFLPDPEKCLLRRLAVFAGGFTIEAATAVMDGGDNGEAPIIEGIARLLEKSLITRDGSIAGRWRLLETIRAYALEKLVASDEAERTARRHAEFFRDLIAAPAPEAQVKSGIRDITHRGRELDNVRAALDWAFSPLGDPVLGIVLTAAYAPVWMQLSLVVECRERIGRALDSVVFHSDLDARLTMRERAEREMDLQMALGPALIATKSWSDPDIGRAYARAWELCRQLGDHSRGFTALRGLQLYHVNLLKIEEAQHFAEEALRMAERLNDPARLVGGHMALGATLYWQGKLQPALAHFQRGFELFDPDMQFPDWPGSHPGVQCQFYQALISWMIGYPDRSLGELRAAVGSAETLGHPITLAQTLCWAAVLHIFRHEPSAVADYAERASRISNEHRIAEYHAYALCVNGLALAASGESEKGPIQVAQGVESYGLGNSLLVLLALQADAQLAVAKPEAALASVAAGLEAVERMGGGPLEAELHRLKGEALLASGGPVSEAETALQRGIDVARRQNAKSWELRGAMSLARLWTGQGRRSEARDLLAPILGWFKEGFETADLEEAKTLLDQLAKPAMPRLPRRGK
jgi:predicted ATPase/DNA-binding winged helix-turn-helix (wHTH) protein